MTNDELSVLIVDYAASRGIRRCNLSGAMVTYAELAEQCAIYARRIMELERQVQDARAIIADLMDLEHDCREDGEDMSQPCPRAEAARRFLKLTERA